MIDKITALSDAPEIQDLIQEVDACRLLSDLGSQTTNRTVAESRLRVAATMSFAQFISADGIEALIQRLSAPSHKDSEVPQAQAVFRKWSGYLNALLESDNLPTIDDLLYFSAVGLVARCQTEVRSLLQRKDIRSVVNDAADASVTDKWSDFIQNKITVAILLLVRQENHSDISQASDFIQRLAEFQKQVESGWLAQQNNAERQAITLLGLYHIAQAVIRTSEFLLNGSVQTDGKFTQDFSSELRRLILHSEEYFAAINDIDNLFWLTANSIVLLQLREDSIWVSGLGISERLDNLLFEIADKGREKPVFSLLPSQQDALRQNLLDPSRVAIILQMPTSAGKTLLAEFSIVQTFEAYKQGTRVAYVVPTRALATQVRRTLAEDLRPLGIQVSAAGSAFEEDPYEIQMLQSADGIIVATPEKLDLLLRAHPDWFKSLRLIVVDEAHMLKERDRGVRLELLLANIRREQPQSRLLLLTPFMDNATEIATWLGGNRGQSVSVFWRPSQILLGFCTITGRGGKRSIGIEWKDPYTPAYIPKPISIPTTVPSTAVQTGVDKIVYLSEYFQRLGTVLAMCSASRADAEDIAKKVADKREILPEEKKTPALRLAIAMARNEYGKDCVLAHCLERGTSFHHSALSSTLRYLIEDQIKSNTVNFIAATTTLAQGMNFPVATILVHSISKPYGGGNLSPGEFWNIAGRAGRVGMADKGLVVFTNPRHRDLMHSYSESLTEDVKSALLQILSQLSPTISLKDQYRTHQELRPLVQYLAHAAATGGPNNALVNLEELLQASLVSVQVKDRTDSQKLRMISRRYLEEISQQNTGYLKVVDNTGLGSFSFNELYGKINSDNVLGRGPRAILDLKQQGIYHLIDALQWLPELSLAIGKGEGQMDVESVSQIVQGWMDGQPVCEFSHHFQGEQDADKVRKAATYIYSKVSQTVSWGAHAYMKGWGFRNSQQEIPPQEAMLPAYIQHGVNTPEAAVASLLGVPREFAQHFASEYRDQHGELTPQDTPQFKEFIESADKYTWSRVVSNSSLSKDIDPEDVRTVWRQMQGLN